MGPSNGADASSAHEHVAADDHVVDDAVSTGLADTTLTTVATVGVVGVAAVLFEAALIPGLVLGVAAALAPSYVPRLGGALNPLLRSGVRGVYKLGHKTREMMSEAREHLHDIAAEVEAEKDFAGAGVPNGKAAEAARA